MIWEKVEGKPNWADWHRWFAWYPVWIIRERMQTNDGWVVTKGTKNWLEYVERRGSCGYECGVWWEYRPVTRTNP